MPNPLHPLEIYLEHLRAINGTPLTQREIDVISCLLNMNGRSRQYIANFLSVTLKTVNTHVNNAKQKFDCNIGRMVAIIENSDQFLTLKEQYYSSLLINSLFQKTLNEVTKAISGKITRPKAVLVYWEKKPPFLKELEHDLREAGLEASLEGRKDLQSFDQLTQEIYQDTTQIYFIPDTEMENIPKQTFQPGLNPYASGKIFFFAKASRLQKTLQENSSFTCIDSSCWLSYYHSLFIILKKALPGLDLDRIFTQFENATAQNRFVADTSSLSFPRKPPEDREIKEGTKKSLQGRQQPFMFKKLAYALLAILSSLGIVLFLALNRYNTPSFEKSNQHYNNDPVSLQADLEIPSEDILLSRPHLIEMMEKRFQKQTQGIKTIALIGMGGSGKTTLARQYAYSQNPSVVWEINAETNVSLINSLEALAYTLCKTSEEKQVLMSLKEVHSFTEKGEKVLQLLKYQLQDRPNWVLIYDNVEKMRDIQKYFPSDGSIWGEGKVIITTQDNHIQNNGYVKDAVLIEELSKEEKLLLYTKIMNHGDKKGLKTYKPHIVEGFLEKLPSFPLDVSIAAYYMKATEINPDQYLQYLANYSEDFSEFQKNISSESTGYLKTRFHVISLPLERLVAADKNFGDLLLLVSFLDFRNIPRFLLDQYKGKLVVDHFVYSLKKYSLISKESLKTPSLGQTFSVHPCTQEIGKIYLLKKFKMTEDQKDLAVLASVLEKCIEDSINKEDYLNTSLLLIHTEAFLGHGRHLNDKIKQCLACQLGGIYHYLGDYARAQQLLEENMSRLNQEPDKNNLLIIKNLIYLGSAFKSLKQFDKSRDVLEQSLTISKKYFPQNYELIARASTHLGNTYRKLGDHKKAKYLLEEGALLYQKYLPENYSGIARASAYLGTTYKELGLFAEAESSLQQALSIYESKLPENYVGIGWIYALLGRVYLDLGEFSKSVEFLKKGLTMYRKFLPENHIRISWVFEQLGFAHKGLRNYEEARRYFEIASLNYKKHYGEEHKKTLNILKNIEISESLGKNQKI